MGESSDSRTRTERRSDLELVTTRTFNAPPRIVFAAWATPDVFMRWWPLKSSPVPLRSYEMDIRTGGSYRLEFGHDASEVYAFFGSYVEVIPPSRLVWTNEESDDGPVTTVTFEDKDGQTLLTLSELYPSKQALDDAFIGMEGALPAQFEQLDALLAGMGAGAGTG